MTNEQLTIRLLNAEVTNLDSTVLEQNNNIFLGWVNINYTIKIESQFSSKVVHKDDKTIQKVILNKLYGCALPGQLLAIMGPSGCGKTSLLNIIADRQLPQNNDKHHITRTVKANNKEMNHQNFGKICAYIMQDDILMECLTPRESLYFGARLKLKADLKTIKARVDELINQFGLKKCADSIIGGAMKRGISGGERKRTSIAYELISNPPVIIIDEPTTGMDSFTSIIIVKHLKDLAKSGKTVSILILIKVCTIHQPGSEIFKLIDRLILLKDGNMIYQGNLSSSINYFEKHFYPIPEFCNPFDYFFDLLNHENYSLDDFIDCYKNNLSEDVKKEIKQSHSFYKNNNQIILSKENERQVSWCLEFSLLFKRSVINYFRNTTVFYSRLIQYFLNTFILSSFYWNIGGKGETFYTNFLGFFFNCVNNLFINGLYTTLFYIPTLKAILMREYSAKLYRISTFFFATICTLLIPALLYSIIFSNVLFWCIQLKTNISSLIMYTAMNFFDFIIGSTFGILIGAALDSKLIFSVAPVLLVLQTMGSGYYRNSGSFPSALVWLNYISPYRYALEIMIRIEQDEKKQGDIANKYDFDFGYEICVVVLIAIYFLLNILAFICIKKYASRF